MDRGEAPSICQVSCSINLLQVWVWPVSKGATVFLRFWKKAFHSTEITWELGQHDTVNKSSYEHYLLNIWLAILPLVALPEISFWLLWNTRLPFNSNSLLKSAVNTSLFAYNGYFKIVLYSYCAGWPLPQFICWMSPFHFCCSHASE